jgi:hypothetical protein
VGTIRKASTTVLYRLNCFSFELTLPLDLSIIEPQVSPVIILKPEPLRGVRILVAEDGAVNQRIIKRARFVLLAVGVY